MNRLSIPLLLLCAVFCATLAHAQEVLLKGRVIIEGSETPVAGVVVSVQDESGGQILAYGITDDEGRFSLPITGKLTGKYLLTTSSMMTETVTSVVSPQDGTILIPVKQKLLTLRESRVQAPKVSAQGDTINYNVASYVNADDKSIGEVLKRIPGIKVTSDGEIFYQNMQISKFYVEGLDLMQGRYGLATNNVDPCMVATIQVLENHQPIRVLEGMEIPPQAAINLKLRKSALGAFFLTAQGGLGFSPLLFSNELLGMRFTQSQQNLLMYKNDNTGRDITTEMTSFYGTSSSPLLSWFSPEVLGSPSMEKRQYLFNNAHLVSLNDLHLLKKDVTLTSNLHFFLDRQKKNGYYRQTILDPAGGELLIAEDVSSELLRRELAGTVTMESNGKNRYLSNRTDANLAWNQHDCSTVSDHSLTQTATLPSVSVENMFTYKTGQDRWSSHLLFSRQDNALRVSPVLLEDLRNLDDVAIQQILCSQFEADVRYYRSIRLSRHLSLEPSIRPFVKRKSFVSDFISGDYGVNLAADTLSNNLIRTELGTDIGGGLRFKKRKFTAYLSASGQYLYVSRDNHLRPLSPTGQHYFLLSPGGYVEYSRRGFTYRLNASYRQRISDIRNDLTGYIMSSYRSFSRADGVLPQSGRASFDALIQYKDIQSAFFSALMAGYALTHRNTLRSLSYEGILCQATEIEYPNNSDNWWADVELGTDIRVLSSTVKINGRLSRTNAVILYQGYAVDYSMNVLQVTPALFTMFGSVASLSYEAQYQLGRSLINGKGTQLLHDLRQSATVSLSPFKNASIRLSCNHYYNSALPSNPSRFFAHAGLSYKYKKTEWLLDWSNIFNTKENVSYYYDDISTYCSRYTLRPMEILLRVRFTIL